MSDWLLGVDEVKDASGEVEREATPGLETTESGPQMRSQSRVVLNERHASVFVSCFIFCVAVFFSA